MSNFYKLIRDQIILTNRRLIFIDKQGVTGKKSRVSFDSI
ncbi:PH domain-containing protein [Escherichia coli]